MTDIKGSQIKLNVSGRPEAQTTDSSESIHKNEAKAQAVVAQQMAPKTTEPDVNGPEEQQVDELAEALQLAEDNRDKWMRAVAEMENYKKRSIQERSRLIKYKNEDLIRDLLPIVDNLDRAISAAKGQASSSLLEGVKMTANMFRDVLSRFGVSPIESVNTSFNPEFHEAIATVKDPDKEPNTIVEELEKGYMYQDRLLRPSKVVVSTR